VVFGLGRLVLFIWLFYGRLLPRWLSGRAAVLGIAAMAVIMVFPDNRGYDPWLFHLNAAGLVGIGVMVLRSGVGVAA
jgi:peptidoglycan/LPS O-acetylase OafA/YrhL